MTWLTKPWIDLIDGSDSVKAEFHSYASNVLLILEDSPPQFFREYTDHGTKHVRGVLNKAALLVPSDIWANEELIGGIDASAFVTAVLLHDLGMHLDEVGFVDLVSQDTRFKPLTWFEKDHPDRSADVPWPVLWNSFLEEVRHMPFDELKMIVGTDPSPGLPPLAGSMGADLDPTAWGNKDRALIGEFLRRHHARLAHEITVYGFPGSESFPVLADGSGPLAARSNLIGAIARSHGEPLRGFAPYLEDIHNQAVRPGGILATFWMAVLRIADYLELEAERAPAMLKELRHITSPLSLAEWEKHKAVVDIVWSTKDTEAIELEVDSNHSLQTNVALDRTIDDLQREMDISAAVLSETYGADQIQAGPLQPRSSTNLRLSKFRVRSNLRSPRFQESLPFVPGEFKLSSAEDLFRRVVRNLYGERPEVGLRELIQNGVDAVRARRALASAGYLDDQSPEIEDWGVKVRVESLGSSERVCIAVIDQGIGMGPNVIRNQFLSVGASHTPASRVGALKAGQFGIGALAGFLLGPSLEVTTRYASDPIGVKFKTELSGSLIELIRCEAAVGTKIRVDCDLSKADAEAIARLALTTYSFEGPPVTLEVSDDVNGTAHESVHVPSSEPSFGWRHLDPCESFSSVRWKPDLDLDGAFAHNGFWVGKPTSESTMDGWREGFGGRYQWLDPWLKIHLRRPSVSVDDYLGHCQLSLDRYELLNPWLSIEASIAEAMGADAAAMGWAIGPSAYPLGRTSLFEPIRVGDDWTLMSPELMRKSCDRLLLIRVPEGTPSVDLAIANASQLLPARTGLLVTGLRANRREMEHTDSAYDLGRELGAGFVGAVTVRTLRSREPADTPDGWVVTKRPPKKRKKGGSRTLIEARADKRLKSGEMSSDGRVAWALAKDWENILEEWLEITEARATFSILSNWLDRDISEGEEAFCRGWATGADGPLIPMGDQSRVDAARRRSLDDNAIQSWAETCSLNDGTLKKRLQVDLGRDWGW